MKPCAYLNLPELAYTSLLLAYEVPYHHLHFVIAEAGNAHL